MENNNNLKNLANNKENFENMVEMAFTELKSIEPNTDLLGSIMFKIEQKKRYIALKNLIFSSGVVLISLTILIWSILFVGSEFAKAEIGTLLSLLSTDAGSILGNWQDYLMYFLESLPVYPLMLVLGSTMLLLIIFKFMSKLINSAVNSLISTNKKSYGHQ